MTTTPQLAALVAALAVPSAVQAANPACSSLPDPIIVAGSSAIGPFIKSMGTILSQQATPTTVIYQKQGSCTGVNAVVNDTTPAGACASGACITGTAIYFDATGTQQSCDLAATGTHVDVGLSDVWVDSCTGSHPPAGVRDYSGADGTPVETMLFVVPKAATQVAIIAEEAYFVFGFGMAGMAMPWTQNMQILVRNALSGTQQIIAHNINVPAGRWYGMDMGGSQQVADGVANSTVPEATIGILGADFYDLHRDTLTALAHQTYHQYGAFYADSTATSFDKRNVRDGHYVNFGYLHLIAHVDATGVPLTSASKRFVDWITGNTGATGTPAPFDIVDVTIGSHLTPVCAMHVQRQSEGGQLSPFTPSAGCGCYFESKVGTTSCQTCTTTCATGTCRRGYCEAE